MNKINNASAIPSNVRVRRSATQIQAGIRATQKAVADRMEGAGILIQLPAWHDLPRVLPVDEAWLGGCYDALEIGLRGSTVVRHVLSALDWHDDGEPYRRGLMEGLRHAEQLWDQLDPDA